MDIYKYLMFVFILTADIYVKVRLSSATTPVLHQWVKATLSLHHKVAVVLQSKTITLMPPLTDIHRYHVHGVYQMMVLTLQRIATVYHIAIDVVIGLIWHPNAGVYILANRI